jgi:hypothetical protein
MEKAIKKLTQEYRELQAELEKSRIEKLLGK